MGDSDEGPVRRQPTTAIVKVKIGLYCVVQDTLCERYGEGVTISPIGVAS